MEQLLDQPEGAEEAADGAPQQESEQDEDAEHIRKGGGLRACQRVLQGTQGTGSHGSGARVAVQSGDTQIFGVACVYLAGGKAFEVRVVEQGGIDLYQSPLGRLVAVEPTAQAFLMMLIDLIIQDRYTPYKFLLP